LNYKFRILIRVCFTREDGNLIIKNATISNNIENKEIPIKNPLFHPFEKICRQRGTDKR